MDPKHLFVDERLKGSCVYCGGPPETVDHVPSRVFLDDPLPENLPVVEACRECNGGFSLDEEYLACLLECVMTGTSDIEGFAREKVRRSLSRNRRLTAQLRRVAGMTTPAVPGGSPMKREYATSSSSWQRGTPPTN